MSATSTALDHLAALAARLARDIRLPAQSACARLAGAMTLAESASALPADLEALCAQITEASHGGTLDALPPRILRHAPTILWRGTPMGATLPGLYDYVMAQSFARPRWLIATIEAWLRDFNPAAPGLADAGHGIAAALQRNAHPRLLAWARAHGRFNLFDAAVGPETLARHLLTGSDNVSTLLAQTGMDDPLRAQGRFLLRVVVLFLKMLPDAMRAPAAAASAHRAMQLLEQPERRRGAVGTALRFDSIKMAGRTAHAFMQGWVDQTVGPGVDKPVVQAFLLRTVDDPRLHPARWQDAGDAATGLMRSWLAAASLDAFFRLISESGDDVRWVYRRSFWSACLKRMPTAEVWVILGSRLAERAKVISDLAGSFGILEGGVNNARQAVLLIRLGNLVFTEWSDIGPIRACRVSEHHAPALYRGTYTGEALRPPSLPFPQHPVQRKGGTRDSKGLRHHGSEGGLWQGCLAAMLERDLHLRVRPEEYMP